MSDSACGGCATPAPGRPGSCRAVAVLVHWALQRLGGELAALPVAVAWGPVKISRASTAQRDARRVQAPWRASDGGDGTQDRQGGLTDRLT